ncbi:M48 family metalloprotease [Rhodoferax sp. GW822-FHT02A01]|uniref:M48 family metalloprotease n=1 Tax=Rhodoferax sp. GW822-FHT02A01 TaxID=3141537 RepID=UPI00315DFBE4
MRLKWIAAALLVCTLIACGTAVVNPVSGETELSAMSEEQEVAEGAKGHQQVLQEYTVYNNPAVQNYVNALGQRLAAHSHRANLQWHFTVLDSPEINAFALPGGYVYVTRGIMAYMESEADLAGVIGHEIGHVTARHGAQRATSQQHAGLGVFAANILGLVLESQGVTGAGQMAGQVSQTVAAGYIASYGREQELQADGLGAEYLARNHYDPHNMVDVITVLKNQERYAVDVAKSEGRPAPTGGGWLASHPSNDQRLQQIKQTADSYGASSTYADDGRSRYLQVVAGLAFGESADQGLVRGRNFYHGGLNIAVTAPAAWTIQNESQQVALVNAATDAALLIKPVPPAVGKTHAEVIRNGFKPTQGKSEATTLNGLQATHFTGVRQNEQGQNLGLEFTLVSGPENHMYALQYAAKDAATLQANRSALREAESSFRAMTAQDRQAAKPWSIKLVPYPKGGFAELAKRSPLPHAEQQLRLVNGFYGGGEPKPGQLVKLVDAS